MVVRSFLTKIGHWWRKLPFLWKYQIVFWSIFTLGSFPMHFAGLRYYNSWDGPFHGIVILRAAETFFSVPLCAGMGRVLESGWYRGKGRVASICIVVMLAVACNVATSRILRPLVSVPISDHYRKTPRPARPAGETRDTLFALDLYHLLLYGGWSTFFLLARASAEAQRKERDFRESKLKLQEAELQMLRSQLDPHFLYNAMNTIVAEAGENQKLGHIVGGLSEYLRYSLANRSRSFVPFGEEIEATLRYLQVEKARLGDALKIETEIDPESYGLPVPGVFLQPLVENAIKYGRRTSPMPLRIGVKAGYAGDRLSIEVANTGRWVERGPEVSFGGVGLDNIRARLSFLYPERHDFQIDAAGGRVTVRILIMNPETIGSRED